MEREAAARRASSAAVQRWAGSAYWVDEAQGKAFCLIQAPDAETAARVHREAHGLVADRIFEVQEGA